jgi:hypothetical protein
MLDADTIEVMEYLTFNSQGQWALHKAVGDSGTPLAPPKDQSAPGTKPYNVYGGKAVTGELHEDTGRRGMLNDFGGGKHPKAGRTAQDKIGKPLHPVDSVFAERNPGSGIE